MAIQFSGLDIDNLFRLQESDPELRELRKQIGSHNTKYKLELIQNKEYKSPIWCEMSTGKTRPYVPESLRKKIFENLHSLSHPGVRASRKLLCSRYFWPSMNIDTGFWAKTCMSCQKAKIHRHTKSETGHFEIPSVRFEHVHIDLVGPLPPSHGFSYMLTIVDRYTRWAEAIPLPNMCADTVAKAFIASHVVNFGVPARMTTDQGTNFESNLFRELTNKLGIHKIHTTAYNPKANGLVERFHRNLKQSLIAHGNTLNWSDTLPFVLIGINNSVKEDIGHSSAEIVYGQTLTIPGEVAFPSPIQTMDPENVVNQLRNSFKTIKPVDTRKSPQNVYIPKDLENFEFVLVKIDKVRKALTPPYDGPFKIIRRFRKNYLIDMNGKNTLICIDRLIPAHIDKNEIKTQGDDKLRKKQVHFKDNVK